ncbi:MAG TPA: hydantoinase/oxoprolinase family protein [Micropepsaceae bacterium]|nr:hydantoinase/oxoprolinase family protein [Micropepsaceae bacterium]
MTKPEKLRLAADIGGTFTDIAAFDEASGRLLLGKTLSTPDALVDGIEAGVAKTATTFADAGLFLHGSTIAINTILERTGAKTALLITEGFRDIYEIGRVNRPDSYNLFFSKHQPLVPREHRYEVQERLLASGDVLKPLDETEIAGLAETLKHERIEAVAVLFLHCYRNPTHELRAKAILQKALPGVFVTTSHELSQEYREFERSSTVAANAYIGPRVARYLGEIGDHLTRAGFGGAFLVVQSTGGLFEMHQAREQCVRMLESGPASGVIATQAVCRETGIANAIAFDMGGTTAKAGVILDGHVLTTGAALIGGYEKALPIQIPMIDIFEVGTGGGSLARVAENGALHVGPESAGAVPGPACYGLGGAAPTVTDANLILGRLGADRFLGGEMRLDVGNAERALYAHVAAPLGMSIVEAASGVIDIAVTKMSYAVKGVTTARGLDVGNFVLVAYGGAGPLHATAVARELGITRVAIPSAPGHFSATGMLFSDLRYDYVRTRFTKLADLDFATFEEIFDALEAEGRRAIKEARVNVAEVKIARALDMRYVGQEHLVTIPVPMELFASGNRDAIKGLFDAEHEQRYGTSAPSELAEIASLRTAVTGVLAKPEFERIDTGGHAPTPSARRGTRSAYFAGQFIDTPVFDRAALLSGNRIAGPALIEEHASTTVLMPGDMLTVDAIGDLIIAVGTP